jgi:hypothetical protein
MGVRLYSAARLLGGRGGIRGVSKYESSMLNVQIQVERNLSFERPKSRDRDYNMGRKSMKSHGGVEEVNRTILRAGVVEILVNVSVPVVSKGITGSLPWLSNT